MACEEFLLGDIMDKRFVYEKPKINRIIDGKDVLVRDDVVVQSYKTVYKGRNR